MSSNTAKFNRLLDALIQMIVRLCPEETAIRVGYEKFKLATSISNKLPWQKFYTSFGHLRNQIIERDEKFFLGKQLSRERLEENVSTEVGADGALATIMNIKHAWTNTIQDGDKERIWNALNSLILLSDAIAADELSKHALT